MTLLAFVFLFLFVFGTLIVFATLKKCADRLEDFFFLKHRMDFLLVQIQVTILKCHQ